MPITPVTALFKVHIRVQNTVTTTPHTSELHCSAQTDVGDPSGYDLGTGASSVPATTAIASFVVLYKACFTNQATILDWTLFQFVTPNWVPVYSTAIGVVGTGGGALEKAHITTLSFRTATGYTLNKVQLAESIETGLFKVTAAAVALNNLRNDLITFSAGTSGGWVVGRNNSPFNAFRFFTGSYSRRLRKLYHLL
jgi:hypothetical protein